MLVGSGFKTFLFLCICAAATSAAKLEKSKRIVGGELKTIDSAPYLVQLRDITGRFFCGGSLVGPYHVLTAAHCLDTTEQRHIRVVAGVTYTDEDGVVSEIAKKFVHPNYVRKTFMNDVAVVKLKTPIRGAKIKPITITSKPAQPGEHLRVSGWGYLSEATPGVSHQMREVRVPTYSANNCKEMYSTEEFTESMMCASVPGVKDACTTDSGGPAVCHNELCGIVSWGTGCARAEYPGVYTNITTVKSFIDKALKS